MTTRKAAASTAKAAAVKIGRFYELQAEVEVPEDYILTEKIRINYPTREQMVAFRAAKTEIDADTAFLGDAAEAVFALYAHRPDKEYAAFTLDVWKHFFGPNAGDQGKSGGPSS